MSVYDDVKKAIQDFATPDIREIKSELKRLEEKIDLNHREIITLLNFDKRLALLEDREARKDKPTQ